MEEFQGTSAYLVKRENGDLPVMAVVPLVPLALEVSLDWKERKVFLVLKEKLAHQVVTLRGLKERGVQREILVKKVTEDWMESL